MTIPFLNLNFSRIFWPIKPDSDRTPSSSFFKFQITPGVPGAEAAGDDPVLAGGAGSAALPADVAEPFSDQSQDENVDDYSEAMNDSSVILKLWFLLI